MSKTVLITGASRGLGRALLDAFPSEYRFILNARNIEIPNLHKYKVIIGDLRGRDTISDLSEEAARQDVDILIHCAGAYQDYPSLCTDYDYIIDVNLVMPIHLTTAIWPIFERKHSGLIIFINSLAGKQGAAGETAYCASKHGLAGFARSLQFDAQRIGVRVLSVFLGAMKTDITKSRIDWDKLIDPQEAAKAIVSLCEDYETMGFREVEIGRVIY